MTNSNWRVSNWQAAGRKPAVVPEPTVLYQRKLTVQPPLIHRLPRRDQSLLTVRTRHPRTPQAGGHFKQGVAARTGETNHQEGLQAGTFQFCPVERAGSSRVRAARPAQTLAANRAGA